MMKTMGWVVPAAFMVVGCEAAADGPVAITSAQLSEQLAAGDQRLEVKLRADGSVREVHVEWEGPGHLEQLAGRLLAIDAAAGEMQVEFLGAVDFSGAGRFRTDEDSRVERSSWLAAAEAALARGADVWVEARGEFGDGRFVASEVRWEDDAEREVEADVSATWFDEATGTLTIGHLTFELAGVPIRQEDDSNDDDLGDDDSGDDGTDDEGGDDSGARGLNTRGSDDDSTNDDDSDDDSTDDDASGTDDDASGSDDDGTDDDGTDDDASGTDDGQGSGGDDDGTDDAGSDDAGDDQGPDAGGDDDGEDEGEDEQGDDGDDD